VSDSNGLRVRGLVNMSASIWFDCRYCNLILPCLTLSMRWWCRISMDFLLFVGAVLVAIWIADWESMFMRMGCLVSIICSSFNISPSQLVWRVASDAAIVSASHVLTATRDCLCEVQCIGDPCSVITDPEIDFLVVWSLAKSASVYDIIGSVEGRFGYKMPLSAVCFRYRTRRFKSFQCRVVGL